MFRRQSDDSQASVSTKKASSRPGSNKTNRQSNLNDSIVTEDVQQRLFESNEGGDESDDEELLKRFSIEQVGFRLKDTCLPPNHYLIF